MRWEMAIPDTFLEIDIAGIKYCCLLDTGCDYSLIPRRLVPSAKLEPVDVDVYTATGTKVEILGWMCVRFAVSGVDVTAKLLVSPDVHEFMLGYDWLVSQKVHWLFDEKALILRGHKIPLKLRRSRLNASRIVVREKYTVQPHTEQNVPVKVVKPYYHHEGGYYTDQPASDWLVEPRTLTQGVYLARALLPDKDTTAAVRIANLTDKPYELGEGAEVGHAEAAQVITRGAEVPGMQDLRGRGRAAWGPWGATSRSTPPQRRGQRARGYCSGATGQIPPPQDCSHVQPVIDALPESLSSAELR